jgi:hypothetical protein
VAALPIGEEDGMTTNELLAHRITQLEHNLATLGEHVQEQANEFTGKVDRLVLAIMGLALTLGTSAVVFALSVISLRGSK